MITAADNESGRRRLSWRWHAAAICLGFALHVVMTFAAWGAMRFLPWASELLFLLDFLGAPFAFAIGIVISAGLRRHRLPGADLVRHAMAALLASMLCMCWVWWDLVRAMRAFYLFVLLTQLTLGVPVLQFGGFAGEWAARRRHRRT